MKGCLLLALSALTLLTGCGDQEDLRGVPVTNNPNLIPSSGGQTAQGPSF